MNCGLTNHVDVSETPLSKNRLEKSKYSAILILLTKQAQLCLYFRCTSIFGKIPFQKAKKWHTPNLGEE